MGDDSRSSTRVGDSVLTVLGRQPKAIATVIPQTHKLPPDVCPPPPCCLLSHFCSISSAEPGGQSALATDDMSRRPTRKVCPAHRELDPFPHRSVTPARLMFTLRECSGATAAHYGWLPLPDGVGFNSKCDAHWFWRCFPSRSRPAGRSTSRHTSSRISQPRPPRTDPASA